MSRKTTYNKRPSYYATPAVYDEAYPNAGERRPNWFEIYEVRGKTHSLMFSMSNEGDRLGNLLIRGIPLEDAKSLFYQMDEEKCSK